MKKIPLLLHLKPKQVEKGRERKKINIIILINSYLTHYGEFEKNRKKNSKNQETSLWLLFKPKQVGKG